MIFWLCNVYNNIIIMFIDWSQLVDVFRWTNYIIVCTVSLKSLPCPLIVNLLFLHRTVASTNMNAVSSRSHAVFTIVLTQKRLVCLIQSSNPPSTGSIPWLGCPTYHILVLCRWSMLVTTGSEWEIYQFLPVDMKWWKVLFLTTSLGKKLILPTFRLYRLGGLEHLVEMLAK